MSLPPWVAECRGDELRRRELCEEVLAGVDEDGVAGEERGQED